MIKLHSFSNYSSSFFLKPTDLDKVSKITGTLNRAAAGWDEMNLDICLTVSDLLLKSLTYIINLSFEKGEVPTEIKTARVIPSF